MCRHCLLLKVAPLLLAAIALAASVHAAAAGEWSPPDPDSWAPPPPSFSWTTYPGQAGGPHESPPAGAVTPARDQFHPKPTGTCWAHIILAALESRALIEEINAGAAPPPSDPLFDYSEYDLVRSLASTQGDCSKGGREAEAVAYLARAASVPDKCAPLGMCFAPGGDYGGDSGGASCRPMYTPLGWARLPADDDSLKKALYNLGPVMARIRTLGTGFHETGPGEVFDAPCEPGKRRNHGLLIAGYDDGREYVKADGSAGRGAWLVKNSNPEWADNGFGWVAYGAGCLGSFAGVFTETREFVPEETVYFHDEHGVTTRYGDTALGPEWAMVRFIPGEDGLAERVDLWAMAENTSYRVALFEDFDGKKPLSELASAEGVLKLRGYYSVPLKEKVALDKGVPVYVAVRLEAPGEPKPLPADARGEPSGSSFYSRDGESFRPLGRADLAIRLRAMPSWLHNHNAAAGQRGAYPVLLNAYDGDGDFVPDRAELAIANGTLSLDPEDPADAGLDFDGDGLENVDEYFSGRDPFRPDAPSLEAALERAMKRGDANGDGKLGRGDLLSMRLRSWGLGKRERLGADDEALDLDGDGRVGRSDRSILKGLIENGPGAYFPARPREIVVLNEPRRNLRAGEIVRVWVAAEDGAGRRSPGAPIVARVDAGMGDGSADILGGRDVGDDGGSATLFVTGERGEGASLVFYLRAEKPGRVYVRLSAPPLGPSDDPRHVPAIEAPAPLFFDIRE